MWHAVYFLFVNIGQGPGTLGFPGGPSGPMEPQGPQGPWEDPGAYGSPLPRGPLETQGHPGTLGSRDQGPGAPGAPLNFIFL